MKIVLTGGGTAGHVIPHLALLEDLKGAFSDIYYIGSKSGIEKVIIENEKIPYYGITVVKLKRKLSFSNLMIPFKLIKGISEAKKVLRSLKPDIVFSKGGFVSVPVVMAAKRLKIPVVLHESDMTMGLANRISIRYCKKVLTTFESTAKNIKKGKGVFTGAPIRPKLYKGSKEKGLKQLNFKEVKPVLLVIGGSSGAVIINEILRKNLNSLNSFNVVHITGRGNKLYELESGAYRQIEFFESIEDIFAAADLIVSRAGSNAITEFLALKKPALLIPLPKGVSRGDQVLNAGYFEKKGYSLVLQQACLTGDNFISKINELIRKKQVLIFNMSGAKNTDGTKKIAFEIIQTGINSPLNKFAKKR